MFEDYKVEETTEQQEQEQEDTNPSMEEALKVTEVEIACVNCGAVFKLTIAGKEHAIGTLPKNWITTYGMELIQLGSNGEVRTKLESYGPWCSRKCFLHWASRELKGDI